MCIDAVSRGPLNLLIAVAPLPLLLVCGSGAATAGAPADAGAGDGASDCSSEQGCEKDHVRWSSLLQLNTPQWRGPRGTDSQWHEDLGDEALLRGGLTTASELREGNQRLGQQLFQQVNAAETLTGSESPTVKALQELRDSSREAQRAQDLEVKSSAEVDNALLGAMQRVQRAGEVEMQEQGMEAEATRRLQEAAKSARQVQMLEDQMAGPGARAAGLLQNAIRKLQGDGANQGEDALSPKQMHEMLIEVEKAEKLASQEESSKARASESLQESLQRAATVVEALKASKEAQTSKWLQDALRELQSIHASWNQRTEAEAQVTKGLEGAVRSSESAENSVVALVQDVEQKIRSAQNTASQESAEARHVAEAREAREKDRDRQAVEVAKVSQLSQLSNKIEAFMQQEALKEQHSRDLAALEQRAKAASDAQHMQLVQSIQQAEASQAMLLPNLSPQEYTALQPSPRVPMQMEPVPLQYSPQSPTQLAPQVPMQIRPQMQQMPLQYSPQAPMRMEPTAIQSSPRAPMQMEPPQSGPQVPMQIGPQMQYAVGY
jgi:hypothetical protein